MQSCNCSSSTIPFLSLLTPPPPPLNSRPLLTSPPFSGFKVGYGDVNRRYFSMLTVLRNRAGWLGAKSPWLPWSSNCLFPVLLCLGINYLCSACTWGGEVGWKRTQDKLGWHHYRVLRTSTSCSARSICVSVWASHSQLETERIYHI